MDFPPGRPSTLASKGLATDGMGSEGNTSSPIPVLGRWPSVDLAQPPRDEARHFCARHVAIRLEGGG